MTTLTRINQKALALLREGLDPGEFALYARQFERQPEATPLRPPRSAVSFEEIRTRIAALRAGGGRSVSGEARL